MGIKLRKPLSVDHNIVQQFLTKAPKTERKNDEDHERGTSKTSQSSAHNFSKIPILPLQPKSKVNTSRDIQEQEADRIADQTVGDNPKAAHSNEHKKAIQAKHLQASNPAGHRASPALAYKINHHQGEGTPIPPAARSFFEHQIGFDFSKVRVHTGARAIQMNRRLKARAFTLGQDVYFNRGQYDPESREGKRLLAHELVHVVQQRQMRQPHTIQTQREKGKLEEHPAVRPAPPTQSSRSLYDALALIYQRIRDIYMLVEIEKETLRMVQTYSGIVFRQKRYGRFRPDHLRRFNTQKAKLSRLINQITGRRLRNRLSTDLLSQYLSNMPRRHQIISVSALISGNRMFHFLTRRGGLIKRFRLYFLWLKTNVRQNYQKDWS